MVRRRARSSVDAARHERSQQAGAVATDRQRQRFDQLDAGEKLARVGLQCGAPRSHVVGLDAGQGCHQPNLSGRDAQYCRFARPARHLRHRRSTSRHAQFKIVINILILIKNIMEKDNFKVTEKI